MPVEEAKSYNSQVMEANAVLFPVPLLAGDAGVGICRAKKRRGTDWDSVKPEG